jgi:alkanesulfonate monooxygenase SsuD/methylene tetrahydromethanopterin reductase-like flavin-dependent oxidoreductase (luciferase family)
MVQVNGSVTASPLDQRAPLTGTVEQVADDLAELNSLGIAQVFWSLYTHPEEQPDALEQLLAHVPKPDR